jgi:hypothetical protein
MVEDPEEVYTYVHGFTELVAKPAGLENPILMQNFVDTQK